MSLRARQLRSEHAGHESPTRQFGKWFTRGVAGAALGLAVAGTSAFTLLAPRSAIAQGRKVIDELRDMYEAAKPYRNPETKGIGSPSILKAGYFSAMLLFPLSTHSSIGIIVAKDDTSRRPKELRGHWLVTLTNGKARDKGGKEDSFDVTAWVNSDAPWAKGFDFIIMDQKLNPDGTVASFQIGIVPLADGSKPLFSDDGTHQMRNGHLVIVLDASRNLSAVLASL